MFNKVRVLSGYPSLFLDGFRFIAAVLVFVCHAQGMWFPQYLHSVYPVNLAHGAVVVFFVLSGFVIAHTTTNKNRGAKEYAVARLSRLYSVYLPALFFTLVLWLLLKEIDIQTYHEYTRDKSIVRFVLATFFMNEVWFLSAAPIINEPIWSLSYEFWYYFIFGCFFFKPKGIKGLIIPLLACIIAGPKILIMMFMWLIGWVAYHLPRPKISNSFSWSIMVVLIFTSILLMIYLPSYPHSIHATKLHWADKFISDWIVSVFIGVIFYLLPPGDGRLSDLKVVKYFRIIADLTFPIYVLHFPVLVVLKSLLSSIGNVQVQFSVGLLGVFILCSVTGIFLESKRQYWSKLFTYIIK